jgi:hypothetical protein
MRFRAAVAIFAGLVLFVAACGDDDDSTASNGDTSATSDDGGSDSGDSGDSSGDGGFAFSSEECVQIATALAAGYTAAFTGANTDFSELQDRLQEFRDSASDEIADDVDKVADAYTQFAEAADDAGLDLSDPTTFTDPAKATELAEFSQQVDEIFTDDVQASVDRIDEYLQDKCGS